MSRLAGSALALLCIFANAINATPTCCFKNGQGAAILYGLALIDINDGRGEQIYSPTLLAVDPHMPAISFLVNSSTDPNLAVAGFVITQNSTAQIITYWQGNTPSGTPNCTTTAVPLPVKFIPGFSFCPGQPNSFFPTFETNYSMGQNVNIFTNPKTDLMQSGQSAFFLDPTLDCGLVNFLSTSPFNGEVFSFQPFYGVAEPPPPQWVTKPKFC